MLKKDSLLKGTLILALAALVARLLGMFQRIPLEYMLNDEGQAAFIAANQIYLLLLVIATAGFPSAISKMVSERMAQGKYQEAKRIYKAALVFGTVTGILLASLLVVFAPQYAALSKQPSSTLAIQAIAPTLVLFPIIAMMRGYFQGRQMMSAGGLSQIIEQIARVVIGLALGYYVLTLGYTDASAAAAITFGNVFGSIGAFAVMIYYSRKLKVQDRGFEKQSHAEARAALLPNQPYTFENGSTIKFRTIYAEILKMSLPALITSMTINLVYFFDTTFFARITEQVYTIAQSQEVYADLGNKATPLAGIPPILAIALGSSIIPIISAAFARKDQQEVNKQTSAVMKIVCITGVPIALFLTIAAYAVTGLLFSSPRGSEIVAMLCAGTILQITMMTTNSILYGMGKQRQSMFHTFAGLGSKVIVSSICGLYFGVMGFIIGSTACFLVVTLLNLKLIQKDITLNVFGKRWMPYITAIAISALGCYGVHYGMLIWTDDLSDKLSYLVTVLASGMVLVGLYGVLLLKFRVLTVADVESLPGKLRGPMKKVMSILRVR